MYINYDDLINGSYEETLNVLGRHKDNASKAIEDAIGEVKAYIFKLYDVDMELKKEGDERCSFLVKIVRDIAIYNIYCISSPYQMSDTRRLKYEDDIAFLKLVSQQKAFIPDLPVLSSPKTGGSYYISYGGNKRRQNQY